MITAAFSGKVAALVGRRQVIFIGLVPLIFLIILIGSYKMTSYSIGLRQCGSQMFAASLVGWL